MRNKNFTDCTVTVTNPSNKLHFTVMGFRMNKIQAGYAIYLLGDGNADLNQNYLTNALEYAAYSVPEYLVVKAFEIATCLPMVTKNERTLEQRKEYYKKKGED